MKNLLMRLVMVAAVGLFGLGLAACGGDEGEAEKVGKTLDKVVKDAGEKLDEAVEEADKKLDE